MKKSIFLLTTFSTALLTACGGGGGGSNNNAATNLAPQPEAVDTANLSLQGDAHHITFNNDTLGIDNEQLITLDPQTKNTLTVDGRSYVLPTNQAFARTGEWKSGQIEMETSNILSYATFGRIADRKNLDANGTANAYIFTQGYATPETNMPTSGSAQYEGKAIMGTVLHDETAPDDAPAIFADAKFNVDFGNKSLTGDLYEEGQAVVHIKADIAGNRFNGTYNGDNQTTTTKGGFYGPNADEIAGVSDIEFDNFGNNAAFGAKKQP